MKCIRCDICGSQVSSPTLSQLQIRADVVCYGCSKNDAILKALRDLRLAVIDAATQADWCHPGLGEALHVAEQVLPKHLQ